MTEIQVRQAKNSIFEDSPFGILSKLHRPGVGLFTESYDTEQGLILGLSNVTKSSVHNNGLATGEPSDQLLDQTEHALDCSDRTRAFYVPIQEETEELRKRLIDRGYVPRWKDAWMAANQNKIHIEAPKASSAIRVESQGAFRIFLNLLRESHIGEITTENPYGELSAHELGALGIATRQSMRSGASKCFVIDREDASRQAESVATVTVTNIGRIAYVANVATLPRERRKDYGKAALRAAIEGSFESIRIAELLGVDPVIYLATEPDQGPYEAFKKMGFKHRFSAAGYVQAA